MTEYGRSLCGPLGFFGLCGSLWPSVLSSLDLTQRTLMRSEGLGREEGRMWVFIRPGVVRSANEEKAKLRQEFCPIHPFDGNYQFPGSFAGAQ
jgi:hypothetical protein